MATATAQPRTHKRCSYCRETLAVELFHRDCAVPGGLKSRCKRCTSLTGNSDRKRAYNREYARRHPEKARARSQRYERTHRQRRTERLRTERELYPERVRARNRAWSARNPAKAYEYSKRYRLKNPDKVRGFLAARRARKEAARTQPYSRRSIFERDNFTCRLCHKPIDMSLLWPHRMSATIDHIVPIAAGGADAPDNVQAAHFTCNSQKSSKMGGVLLRR